MTGTGEERQPAGGGGGGGGRECHKLGRRGGNASGEVGTGGLHEFEASLSYVVSPRSGWLQANTESC